MGDVDDQMGHVAGQRADTSGPTVATGHPDDAKVRLALVLLAVALVGYLLASSLPEAWVSWVVVDALWLAALLAAAVLTGVAARRHENPAPMRHIATAIAALWLGDLLWLGEYAGFGEVAFPSWADVAYLTSYVLLLLGVVGLLRQELGRVGARGWLDALIAALGLAAVTAALFYEVVLEALDGEFLVVLVGLAYPILDLALLSVVAAGLALRGHGLTVRWTLIGVGLLWFALGDLVYLAQEASGSYEPGGILDLTWLFGSVLFALAAIDRRRQEVRDRAGSLGVVVVPAVFAGGGLAVLTTAGHRPLPTAALHLALAALLVVFVRVGLAFRDVALLHETRYQATTDELTELHNRRAFNQQAAELLASRGPDEPLALLLLDLDHFKEINDTLGHSVGDDLLRLIGPRLRSVFRQGDRLFRLGGDEFAVLLPGTAADAAYDIGQRLRVELRRPFALDAMQLHINGSVGVVVCPDHGDTQEVLLQRADVAMYAAKAARSGVEVYEVASDPHGRGQLQLLDDLRRALREDQLVLHYQPKWSLTERSVIGVEALVRWEHPADGLLAPDQFLPLVDKTGLMNELTRIVLRKATAQCQRWQQQGIDLPIAVNISASSFLDELLVDLIAFELEQHDLDPGQLILEITENTLIADPARATEILERLRVLGVRVSVDDYGTGYCSLAYLREFPVDELKLDRTFVQHLMSDERSASIVRSTVELAHSLGLEMVAEGVEDQLTLEALSSYGCDVAQGYHLSRPMPPADIPCWLEQAAEVHGPATSI